MQVKKGMEVPAAFFESRRVASMKGATTEFEKQDGLTFSSRLRQLFFADARISKGMTDDSQFNHASEFMNTLHLAVHNYYCCTRTHDIHLGMLLLRYQYKTHQYNIHPSFACCDCLPTGSNDISLERNDCGALFAINLDGSWSGVQARVRGGVLLIRLLLQRQHGTLVHLSLWQRTHSKTPWLVQKNEYMLCPVCYPQKILSGDKLANPTKAGGCNPNNVADPGEDLGSGICWQYLVFEQTMEACCPGFSCTHLADRIEHC